MAERFEIVEKTLIAMLEEKKYVTLRDILSTMNPSDVAAVFEDLEEDQIPLMFRLLPKELAAETFVEMEPDAQELLIRGFSDNELKEVLDELYVDDAADLVEEMPRKRGAADSPAGRPGECAPPSTRFCAIRITPPVPYGPRSMCPAAHHQGPWRGHSADFRRQEA